MPKSQAIFIYKILKLFTICLFISFWLSPSLALNTMGATSVDINSAENKGVQIVHLGEIFNIIIPASLLFPPDSPKLLPEAANVLDPIVAFIRQYKKLDVQVAAYTDNTGSYERNLALTQQQASHVADYLWESGIDARFQNANGFGEESPIANNQASHGRAMNRRVEITFREITD